MYGWKTSLPSAPNLNRKAKHTKCWDVQMKTPIGLLSAGNKTRTTCTFEDNVAREKCALSTTSLDFLGAFKRKSIQVPNLRSFFPIDVIEQIGATLTLSST